MQRSVLEKICNIHFKPLEMKKNQGKNGCILNTKEQFLIMHHKTTREKRLGVRLCCLFIIGLPTDSVPMMLPFSKVPAASPLVPCSEIKASAEALQVHKVLMQLTYSW